MSADGLVLEEVGVAYGARAALAPTSARLSAGSLVALLGPNGAGKSSLVKAVAGLVPASGRILLDGRAVSAMTAPERARALAYLPQGHQVHWPLAARDVVALGRFPHGAGDPRSLAGEDRAAVEEAMARAEIAHLADRPVSALSGGEKARVALARVLATRAPVILADEPTAALDPRYQIAIMRALAEEARRGALVVAVTHDLGLAARLADRTLLLKEGRLVADGAPDAALTPERLAAVYGVSVFAARHEGAAVLVPWSAA